MCFGYKSLKDKPSIGIQIASEIANIINHFICCARKLKAPFFINMYLDDVKTINNQKITTNLSYRRKFKEIENLFE